MADIAMIRTMICAENNIRRENGFQRHMSYHLVDILRELGHPRILVLGDLILDRYIWGNAERISQEAPVILLREDRQEVRLGGAANVVHMLRGLEAEVTLAGVTGADSAAQELRDLLTAIGADCSALLEDPTRPTTVKERLIGRAQNRHPHQMMRVDRESRTPLCPALARQFCNIVEPLIAQHSAILISDYAKGVCTPEILHTTIRMARKVGVPVIVDPGAGVDYTTYQGATAITPNRLETSLATGREIVITQDAFAAGKILCESVQLDHVFVTLDSDGIALVTADGQTELLPTRKREVYDITGAGDMVLAMIGVGTAEEIAPADLARLANVAGGLEVEQIGVAAITREQILADLLTGAHGLEKKIYCLDEVAHQIEARRKLGQRIVLTNGCFDLLHVGHVTYLQQAAREGDCLVVAVNSDASVRQLNKAPDRPLVDQTSRATMLAALKAVDYVLIFDETTPHAVIERLKPDLLVKGGTYSRQEIVGWELVESYGGAVKPLGVVPGISTTDLLNRLRKPAVGATEFPQAGEGAIPLAADRDARRRAG